MFTLNNIKHIITVAEDDYACSLALPSFKLTSSQNRHRPKYVDSSRKLNEIAFYATMALALAALAFSAFYFPVNQISVSLIAIVAITLFFSLFAMIQIPGIKIHITISDILVFATLLVFGGPAATILAVIDSAAGSLNFRRRGIPISLKTVLLNAAIAGIAMFTTYKVATLAYFDPIMLAKTGRISDYAIMLTLMALTHFFVNSVFVAIFTSFKTEKSFWKIWYDFCLNALVISLVSAMFAGASVKAYHRFDSVLFTIAAGIALVIYFTYSRYVDDIRRNAEKAETAERQRAEQAESHIEELRHHISQQEVTEKALRESKEKFKYAAYHDSLTGLPNRNMLIRQLQFLLKRIQQVEDQPNFAVLFLDLNRFKTINDSLGHSTGDSLIKSVGKRISKLIREKDMVARLSGDEFAIILNETSDIDELKHFAEMIRQELSRPFTLDERKVFTSVSIGIAISKPEYESAEHLLRDADIAMYQAKASQNDAILFDDRMHTKAVNLMQVETDLRYALERNELVPFFQPIIDLQSMELMGFEALMRWKHPERGLVSPGEFIPVSEDTGLIIPMTVWMIRDSCEKLARWRERYPEARDLMISINLSGKHFTQDDLVATVKDVLNETNIEPRHLKLELTESAVMDNAEFAISILKQLKRVGVKLSIDDFGTGYSSLSYLHKFPIDTLKIDRSFVSRMENGTENGEIVRTVVALAKALGLTVIAEGIETIHQLHQLRVLGSEYGQGFLFSRPVPENEIDQMLLDPGRWKNVMPEHNLPIVPAPEAILQLGDM